MQEKTHSQLLPRGGSPSPLPVEDPDILGFVKETAGLLRGLLFKSSLCSWLLS